MTDEDAWPVLRPRLLFSKFAESFDALQPCIEFTHHELNAFCFFQIVKERNFLGYETQAEMHAVHLRLDFRQADKAGAVNCASCRGEGAMA